MIAAGSPLSSADALAQRRLEGDFAAHGALGDLGDPALDAGIIGELVDAFLADHGGIHVGDEKFLAPIVLRLDDDVDRFAADDVAQIAGHIFEQRRHFAGLGILDQEGDIDRHARLKPIDRPAMRQIARGLPRQGVGHRGAVRSRNQRCHIEHAVRSERRKRTVCDVPSIILIAGPTASGKSALALDARRTARRHDHQRRFHAGLSRPAHHHRAADAGGRAPRAAPALRSCRCRGELFGRPLVRRGGGGVGGGASAKAARPSSSAAPAFISTR